jgi:hypothetical protein
MEARAGTVNKTAMLRLYFRYKRAIPKLIVEHLHGNMHQSVTVMNSVFDLRTTEQGRLH